MAAKATRDLLQIATRNRQQEKGTEVDDMDEDAMIDDIMSDDEDEACDTSAVA